MEQLLRYIANARPDWRRTVPSSALQHVRMRSLAVVLLPDTVGTDQTWTISAGRKSGGTVTAYQPAPRHSDARQRPPARPACRGQDFPSF